mmetsp:Transcript_11587/g.38214  ORF Transcript_11587/g.38214 Transcript_11587/m.38214 type:complete len:202 (-) Transcript_11587:836-1441(-)
MPDERHESVRTSAVGTSDRLERKASPGRDAPGVSTGVLMELTLRARLDSRREKSSPSSVASATPPPPMPPVAPAAWLSTSPAGPAVACGLGRAVAVSASKGRVMMSLAPCRLNPAISKNAATRAACSIHLDGSASQPKEACRMTENLTKLQKPVLGNCTPHLVSRCCLVLRACSSERRRTKYAMSCHSKCQRRNSARAEGT